ncbi:MAG: FprA family A-type flavoprotein [Bacteroidota bacterium]
MNKKRIIDVTDDVKWIGIYDPDIVTFDIVMETKFGTTYNSYFINAEKKAIIETAKEKYKVDYLEKVTAVCNPEEIEYIILDHTEPDHSGSLKHLLKIAPQATVVGSGNAIRYLNDIMGVEFKHLAVKDGETLSLGNKTLKFISAPNLHWPDTMYTYLVEDKLLFTCDSFGAHYCHEELFDDKVGNFDEAFKYYFDVILGPFSKFMIKAVEKVRALDINMICTGHGPILRSNWKKYVDISDEYAHQNLKLSTPLKNRILIVYVSAYGYTGALAEFIADGIRAVNQNIVVDIIDIEKADPAVISQKICEAGAIIVGSPTINQNILPQIFQFFSMINPIRDRGKMAASFGSYGWSGEGVKIIDANLKALKLTVDVDGLAVKFNPHDNSIGQFKEFGKVFAEKYLECQGIELASR